VLRFHTWRRCSRARVLQVCAELAVVAQVLTRPYGVFTQQINAAYEVLYLIVKNWDYRARIGLLRGRTQLRTRARRLNAQSAIRGRCTHRLEYQPVFHDAQ